MRPVRRQVAVIVGCALILLLAGIGAYGFSLRLPLFSDDIVQTRWLTWHTVPDLWLSARGLGYYRPLSFTLWQLLVLLQGGNDPRLLHGMVLALHLLNTGLVFALVYGRARAPRRRPAVGLAAALLLLLYPFSYQVVPWVSSLMHPLVTALMLGALLLHEAAEKRPQQARGYRLASIALALLAPFAHETGFLVAPLMLLFMLTAEPAVPLRRALRQIWPYALAAVCGLAVWLAAPKGGAEGHLFDLAARWQNALYLAQGLIYPVTPLVRLAPPAFTSLALALCTAILALGGGLALARLGRGRLAMLALGWFALAVLPAWALLDPEYVQAGARLLYEAAPAAALFWAIPLDLPLSGKRQQAWGQAAAALLVLAIAGGSYAFIAARASLYEQVRRAVAGLVSAQPADGGSVLVVNYPQWLAPTQNYFPMGHEGVVLVPPITGGVGELLWAHTGQEREVKTIAYSGLLPQKPWRFIFPPAGDEVDADQLQTALRETKWVIVTRYDTPNVAVTNVGGLEATGQPRAMAYQAAFGPVALLAGSCAHEGTSLHITLHWQCWSTPTEDLNVFVHLYDSSGKLVTQTDGYPVAGLSRMLAWQPGDEWCDMRKLALPTNLPAGEYTVKVGLYPAGGGDRLSAIGPGGERFPDEAVPVASLTIP